MATVASRQSRHRLATTRSFAYLLIVVVAFATRLYHLNAQSLSYDEAVSDYLTRLGTIEMIRWTASDVQPPLYYSVLKIWTTVAGHTEYSLRFLSLAFSLLAIPLFARLGARLNSPNAGVFAALVAAVHPWYVWHAQDARMYSLLLLLSLWSTYLLLDWLGRTCAHHPGAAKIAGLLVFCYAACLFTHYFSICLISYHLLTVLAVAWHRRSANLGKRFLVNVLLPAAVLYVPWTPIVLQTYEADTSFWRGSLKLSQTASQGLVALFVGGIGETVTQHTGQVLALIMAAVLVSLLLATNPNRQQQGTIVFCLGLVLIPASIVYALAALVPKFNPRYIFPASIGLPLLWGFGAAQPTRTRFPATARLLLALGAISFGCFQGLRGMYWDKRLTRPQFREAILSIVSSRAAHEPVLLVSGHIYPVWQYYAPGIPYTPLPNLRVLSVDKRLSWDVKDTLSNVLSQSDGIWLLSWQDEIVDPMGIVPFILENAGHVEEQRYWHVGVRHYRFSQPPDFSSEPRIQHPTDCNFEGQIVLLGMSQTSTRELTLFWRAETHPLPEIRSLIQLQDSQGHPIRRIHAGPGGDTYPTNLWRNEEIGFGRVALQLPPGTPPGQAQVLVSAYDARSGQALDIIDQAGNPQGQLCRAGQVRIPGNTIGVNVEAALQDHGLRQAHVVWPGITLLGVSPCPSTSVAPGAEVSLALLWQSTAPLPRLGLELSTVSPSRTICASAGDLSPGYPTNQWTTNEVVLSWHEFTVPADSPGGSVLVAANPVRDGISLSPQAPLCTLEVEHVERDYQVPKPLWPADATFNRLARLVGVDVSQSSLKPGETLSVTLYWQAIATATENYSVFVHLLGPDGKVQAQYNGPPVRGRRPTKGWLPGEVLRDPVVLTLDTNAPAGPYHLEIGFFQPNLPGMPRVPATGENVGPGADSAIVGEVTVRP